jgi:hypothetical protein
MLTIILSRLCLEVKEISANGLSWRREGVMARAKPPTREIDAIPLNAAYRACGSRLRIRPFPAPAAIGADVSWLRFMAIDVLGTDSRGVYNRGCCDRNVINSIRG